jgi:histidyl-tRNA synthetase
VGRAPVGRFPYAPPMSKPSSPSQQHTLQAPTGTRDFYPADLNRLRYIQQAWRETSIRHGFDEIDGPTFEHLDLYTIKSGEGIVSELFSFERHGGEKTYALRPEFTPTLARMYAAKANSLPKPTKWFCVPTFFRAERPQRGRLREFVQWNVDLLGDDSPEADAEVIGAAVGSLSALGLKSADVTVNLSDRSIVADKIRRAGVADDKVTDAFVLLDKKAKLQPAEFAKQAQALGLNADALTAALEKIESRANDALARAEKGEPAPAEFAADSPKLARLVAALAAMDVLRWCRFDFGIVRGLAYYTGTVFEIMAEGERAVAGGGRYDNLIELFGGPPTPAVGFGMGDVVLSLVLQDKGLLPSDEEMAAKLGLRPDVFVISSGSDAADSAVTPLVARLRREGLHARRSYKTTKNIGKLLKDAATARARFAAINEQDGATATLKNLDTGEQGSPVPLADLAGAITRP